MPFVLLALFGIGAWVATRRSGPGPTTALEPLTFIDDTNTPIASAAGYYTALLALRRYVIDPSISGPSSGNAKKTFLGAIGAGQPPLRVTDTALSWVQDAFLAGKRVWLPTAFFTRTLADLPAQVNLIATDDPTLATVVSTLVSNGYVLLNPDVAKTTAAVSGWQQDLRNFQPL